MKCFKKCSGRCCPYPHCLLGQVPKAKTPEIKRLKKYLSVPFPEDDV